MGDRVGLGNYSSEVKVALGVSPENATALVRLKARFLHVVVTMVVRLPNLNDRVRHHLAP
ncbi:hypothetical protein D3C72_2409920 [compost metagenome]